MSGFGATGLGGQGQISGTVTHARANNAIMQRRHFMGDNGVRTGDPKGFFMEGLYARDPSQSYAEILRQKPAKDAADRRQGDIELAELNAMKGKCKVTPEHQPYPYPYP